MQPSDQDRFCSENCFHMFTVHYQPLAPFPGGEPGGEQTDAEETGPMQHVEWYVERTEGFEDIAQHKRRGRESRFLTKQARLIEQHFCKSGPALAAFLPTSFKEYFLDHKVRYQLLMKADQLQDLRRIAMRRVIREAIEEFRPGRRMDDTPHWMQEWQHILYLLTLDLCQHNDEDAKSSSSSWCHRNVCKSQRRPDCRLERRFCGTHQDYRDRIVTTVAQVCFQGFKRLCKMIVMYI